MSDPLLSFLECFNVKLLAMKSIPVNVYRFHHVHMPLYRCPYQTGTEWTKPIYSRSSLCLEELTMTEQHTGQLKNLANCVMDCSLNTQNS